MIKRGNVMRVSQISVYCQPRSCTVNRPCANYQKNCKPETPTSAINFNGKFGAWVGGVAGAVAVIAAAIVAAPAAACLAGGGAILGAIGGDVAEDAVNNSGKNNNN